MTINNIGRSRILLVEGVAGIGKSTLIDGLIRKHIAESPERKIRSLLYLTQAHTYGPLVEGEDTNTLTKDKNLNHLNTIINMLRWLSQSVEQDKRTVFYCIIDTLHLTHCVRPGVLSWNDVTEIDNALADIDCKILFLKATEATIWERTIQLRKDNQFITHYAKKFGETLEDLHKHFIKEQDKIEQLFKTSKMEKQMSAAENSLEENIIGDYPFWKG